MAYTDPEIGRVIQAVEDKGKLDKTLIVYINGDNGTSAEGQLIGTPNEVAMLNGVQVPVEDELKFSPGRHTVEFDFHYDGLGGTTLAFNNRSGIGQPGTGTLKVDGTVVPARAMPHTIPLILQWDESFDVGSDTLTGVNDADHKPPFPPTAKLNKLTLKLDRPQLTAEDIQNLEAGMKNVASGREESSLVREPHGPLPRMWPVYSRPSVASGRVEAARVWSAPVLWRYGTARVSRLRHDIPPGVSRRDEKREGTTAVQDVSHGIW